MKVLMDIWWGLEKRIMSMFRKKVYRVQEVLVYKKIRKENYTAYVLVKNKNNE
jgi:hypothetical protein